jgi:hypothetical protein
MDAKRFDAMTRDAAGRSRRRVLVAVIGGLIGGAGVLSGQLVAAPEYDERGQSCGSDADCNAPCRYCDLDGQTTGRCVYACTATQVCNAAGTSSRCVLHLNKGCCVPR